ncbi:MAG: HEAT repeat domain-containing protein [Pseudomonadota bacterium]
MKRDFPYRCLIRILLAVAALAVVSDGARAEAETVLIIVDQVYEYREPSQITYTTIDDFDLPALALAEDMLFAAGMDIVYPEDDSPHDVLLEITIRGRALGSSYFQPVKAYLYTGAQLDGAVVLTSSVGETARSNFLSETQRQFELTINLGYEDPRNAPFITTLEQPGGLVESLARVFHQVWGMDALVPSLYEHEPVIRSSVAKFLGDVGDPTVTPDLIDVLIYDEDERARWEAAWSLGRIGDEQAIPSLIDALQDSSDDVRWFSSWSLRTITGQSFGPDYDAWTQWWSGEDLAAEG